MSNISWGDMARRIAAGEDAESVLDEKMAVDITEFSAYLRDEEGRPDLADSYLAKMREISSVGYGARNTWRAISHTQRRALVEAEKHGGRLDRVGKEYRHRDRHQPYVAIYVATIRNLCSRNLMAWDGGAFDPEAAVVVTERGRFVAKVGESDV